MSIGPWELYKMRLLWTLDRLVMIPAAHNICNLSQSTATTEQKNLDKDGRMDGRTEGHTKNGNKAKTECPSGVPPGGAQQGTWQKSILHSGNIMQDTND